MTINGERTEFSLQRQCEPSRWIPDKGRLNGKTEEVKSINTYLDAVQLKIYDIVQTFISTGVVFDGEKIKARYLGLMLRSRACSWKFTRNTTKNLNTSSAKAYRTRTLQKYKTIKAYVAEFLKYQCALNDIELNQIDYQFIMSNQRTNS